MALEIALSVESGLTHLTHELTRLAHFVAQIFMLSKIVPLRARVSAEIANKWFFAGVRAHVDHQARTLTELLIALVALEPLAVAKVHVLVTQAQRGKLICTHLTRVDLLCVVGV